MFRIFLPFFRLLTHLFCLLVFYFLFRILFFVFNADYFPANHLHLGQLLIKGMRFDISAILVINSLFVLLFLLPFDVLKARSYRRFLKVLFLLTNGVALLFEAADWVYFPFNHKRATAEVLDLILHKSDFLNLLPGFLVDYWYIFLIAVGLVCLLYVSYGWIARSFDRRYALSRLLYPAQGTPVTRISVRVLLLLLTGGLSVIGIRGGLQFVPINIRNAVAVTRSEYTPIVLNTPFSIINSMANGHLVLHAYMDDKSAIAQVRPVKYYGDGGAFRKKNVVLIILESFSKEFTGMGSGRSYTPFLDSLMRCGMVFTNAYANGLHSAEGIPALVAGIPSLMNEYFSTSVYSTNRVTSLPNLLQKEGYASAFYHGGTNGTMSFDVFARGAGYDHYYGRTEYDNDKYYDGNWGIFDDPFLQYFAKGLDTMKQPFFASVFTLTSHPPFPLPGQYKDVFPGGKLAIYPCIGYTDMALRHFFDAVKDQPWFTRTLFIISPDHCSPLASDDYYATGTGRYQIPIIFYAPGDSSLHGENPVLMQQIDVLPSVMDYLHYPDSFFAFGNSVFRKEAPRFVINRLSEVYTWIYGGRQALIFDDSAREAYAFPADTLRRHNLAREKGFRMDTASHRLFRAFVQLYNQALIKNEMTARAFEQPMK